MSFIGRNAKNSIVATLSKSPQFSDMTSVRKHRPDYTIVLLTGLLMIFGLIVMYAIGPQRANVLNNAYGSDYSGSYFFIKQLVSLAFAIGAFFLAAFVPYTFFTKQSGKILGLAVATCLFLAVSGWIGLSIAQSSLGATRWFNLGILGSFQPAEMLKFALLLFIAGFLGARAIQGKINDRKDTLIPLAIVVGLSLLIVVVIQKDLGTGLSIVGITMSMLLIGGLVIRRFLNVLIAVLAIGLVFVFSAPHRIDRITTFLKGDNSSVDDDEKLPNRTRQSWQWVLVVFWELG